MRDRNVTASTNGFVLNGDRYALSVIRDKRSQPVLLELVRKSDHRVVVRSHPGVNWRSSALQDRERLTRSAKVEFVNLARRLSIGHRGMGIVTQQSMASRRVDTLIRRLGIGTDVMERYQPERSHEPANLVHAGMDLFGRALWLTAATTDALSRLRTAAAIDAIRIAPVSGFRSIDYQARLIAGKLRRGQTLEQILAVSALPGFSEHHLGTTVDLHDGEGPALEECFESTSAFRWLMDNARRFGFLMSYPHGNVQGIAYEPWHWRYRAPVLATST